LRNLNRLIGHQIGIRIICLYEDQISVLWEVLQRHFKILDVTDKIPSVESPEYSFGYKGLHIDLALNDERASLTKYLPHVDCSFAVHIKSLILDAWSMLDQKIKIQKINPRWSQAQDQCSSTLFELADREFLEIRTATTELMQQTAVAPISDPLYVVRESTGQATKAANAKTVNAFNFQRITGHFFKDFELEDYKADGFVHDILKLGSNFQKSDLYKCLDENLKIIRDY